MLAAFLNGLVLMAGLIVAIGAQNAFVLRQGIKREHVLMAVAVCTVADILLVGMGVFGLGQLIVASPLFIALAKWLGAAFLLGYACLAFWRAFKGEAMEVKQGEGVARSRWYVLTTALALTFLNPHVYLDTVVLMGSVAIQHPADARIAYMLGANLASALWFAIIGFGARLLVPFFRKEHAWRIFDSLIGVIMLATAASLVL